MVKQFSDRHAKGRIEKFQAFCLKNLGYKCIKVPLPSKTRVAGNFRMFEGTLRCHHAIVKFCLYHAMRVAMGQPKPDKKEYNDELFLLPDEWQQLAEYSAIYEKTTTLAIALQSDMAGSLSIAKLQLTACLVELAGTPDVDGDAEYEYTPFLLNDKQVVFDVVVVNEQDTTWNPNTPFSNLPRRKMCLPLKVPGPGQPDIDDNRMWNVDGKDATLPIMTQNSRKLIKRMIKEMQSYFKNTTDDEKVNMFLNPFVKVFGIMYLSDMRFFGTTFASDCRTLTIKDLLSLFGPDIQDINAQVEKEHNEAMEQEKDQGQTSEGAGPATPLRKSTATHSALAFKQMRRKLASVSVPMRGTANMALADKQNRRVADEKAQYQEEVKREIAEYEAHLQSLMESGEGEQGSNIKWMKLLASFPSPLADEEIKKHGERLVLDVWDANDCPYDAIYATKRFDILGWWMDEKHGGRWKLLQALAVVHLGQPYTNAAVERVFSKTTWVDAARAQQVLDSTFEMRVLDGANRDLVEKVKPLLDQKRAFQESPMAVDEVVKRFAIPIDDGNDEEAKDSGPATAAPDNDDEISAIADAGTQDDSDESESESDEAQNDDSIIRQMGDKGFRDEVRNLMLTKKKQTTGRTRVPPSSTKKAPPSSTKKAPASKKTTKKRK
jgi:hypothetical protein